MNIAIAVTNNMVTEHFGHCDYFLVHELNGDKIVGTRIIKNPPHQKGFLPSFLKKQDVDVVICGNIGEMAIKMFEEIDITVLRGVCGRADEIVDQYLKGNLSSSDIICREHAHHHE